MKTSAIEKILEILQAGAESAVDIFDVMSAGYHQSYRKMRRQMRGKDEFHFKTDWAAAFRERQAFYSLLNKLKHDGLVAKEKSSKRSIWRLTKKGRDRLDRSTRREVFSIKDISYIKESSSFPILITFDIPEKESRRRAWLHGALRVLGFSLLQQSVWMGKTKIPEKFLRDLRERDMFRYIHIIETTRRGTIAWLEKG